MGPGPCPCGGPRSKVIARGDVSASVETQRQVGLGIWRSQGGGGLLRALLCIVRQIARFLNRLVQVWSWACRTGMICPSHANHSHICQQPKSQNHIFQKQVSRALAGRYLKRFSSVP